MVPLDVSRRSFLQTTSVALAGATPLMAGLVNAESAEAARPLLAYVGTFSSPLRDVLATQVDRPPGNGRGIHRFTVNRTTGELTPAGVHEMTTSPTCLVLNAGGAFLYCTNETDQTGGDKQGTVSALAVDRADGTLKLLGTARSGGAGPTYVSVHPSGRFVLVANYFGGSVAVLPIRTDGSLGEVADIKIDTGQISRAARSMRRRAASPSVGTIGRTPIKSRPIRRDGSCSTSTWAWTKSLSGSSTPSGACSPRLGRRQSRCRRATGRGISAFTRTAAGSTRFKKKVQPSCCLISRPQPVG